MFSLDHKHLSIGVYDKILVDRMEFVPVYKIVDQFIHDNKLIVGGNLAINLLLKIKNKDNFSYDLYTDNSFMHANNLANDLSSTEFLIQLKTVMPYQKYTIIITIN